MTIPIKHQKEALAPSISGKPVLELRCQLLALEWPQEHLQVTGSWHVHHLGYNKVAAVPVEQAIAAVLVKIRFVLTVFFFN